MHKRIANVIVIVVLLLAPAAFASETRSRTPERPSFNLQQVIKRLLGNIRAFDEILTGSKP